LYAGKHSDRRCLSRTAFDRLVKLFCKQTVSILKKLSENKN